MSTDAAEVLRRRDEILQVMFWMRGEGLAEVVGVPDLQLFLNDSDAATLASDLASMESSGLLDPHGEARYSLSRRGREEGGRRFQDEFAELMRPGHGACADPDCDCHTLGPEACEHVRV